MFKQCVSLLAALSSAVWKYAESQQSAVSITYSCCVFLPREQLIVDLTMSQWLVRLFSGFFLHQTSLLLWYCGICGHLSSCAVVRCPLSSADQVEGSCCQRRAVTNPWLLWFGLKVGHKTCPGTHMQQFSSPGVVRAFVVLTASLIPSGFPGHRGQSRKGSSRMDSVLLSCEFITGV